EPDGNFPTVIYPNPEEAEALAMSLQLGRMVGAELILACDPDGDRYASAIPNEFGEYELLNGNQTGALITYYLLTKWREQGRLTGQQFTVSSLVATELIEDICRAVNTTHYSTLTGCKYSGAVIKREGGETRFIAGGEESYGFLVGDFGRDKD